MATVHPEAHGEAHDEHGHHSPYLHHHFDTPVQQFESDKLGMWLFLATEILMFGGLFCAYAVWRHNHPDVFEYAHVHLNKVLGGANTIVLIFSSFTMAWSIKAIQEGKKMLCAALLVITLLCAATFMIIKYFEYSEKISHGLLWGSRYKPHTEGHGDGHGDPHAAAGGTQIETQDPTAEPGATAEHAPAHELEHPTASEAAGVDRETTIADSTEEKHTPMPVQDKPAIGISHEAGETETSAQDVEHATAEAAQHTAAGTAAPPPAVTLEGQPTEAGTATPAQPLETGSTQVAAASNPPGVVGTAVAPDYAYPSGLKLEPTKIKPAALPPAGLVEGETLDDGHGPEPKNVQTFFAIYFAMTGLHGIHVLAGMIAITVMLVFVLRGKYNAEYWTPIDLTGLFWHVVDLIWIFLFPLLYLIS
jgi:cytochrome c oxidase subunit 3